MIQDTHGGTHLHIFIAIVIVFGVKTKDMLYSKYEEREEQTQRTDIPWQPVEQLKIQSISSGFSMTDKDVIK